MRYLCRLVTPPNIVVRLSGSTKSGNAGGFRFIGIELDDNYFKIAENRINKGDAE